MSQSLEIEFKTLIQKQTYYKILIDFQNQASIPMIQTNHYFDTADMDLKDKGYSLRVREKDGAFELTLKKPQGFAKLEYNEIITKAESDQLQSHKIIDNPIFDILKKDGIPLDSFVYYCSLTTKRIEIPYKSGHLCLDQNGYFDYTDYELEFESSDETIGREEFNELVESYGLDYRGNCISKVARAFNAFYLEMNNNND